MIHTPCTPAQAERPMGLDEFANRCWRIIRCPLAELPAALAAESEPQVISQALDVVVFELLDRPRAIRMHERLAVLGGTWLQMRGPGGVA